MGSGEHCGLHLVADGGNVRHTHDGVQQKRAAHALFLVPLFEDAPDGDGVEQAGAFIPSSSDLACLARSQGWNAARYDRSSGPGMGYFIRFATPSRFS